MKEGLLERIRQVGHWRVNYRPLRAATEQLSLARCREVVEKARVSMRGWDFPHISYSRDDKPESGGYDNAGDHLENWTDWYGFAEFWRMYRSTQFLTYIALREDTMKEEHGNPQVPILEVVSTIYSITEFFEFAHRLAGQGLYDAGANISIILSGTQGRHLRAGVGKFPFLHALTTSAPNVEIDHRLSADQLRSDEYRSFAVKACLEVFDQFGWNPARSQIEADQERFYQRQF
jgi:hypothetical protein